MTSDTDGTRSAFEAAASGFAELVASIPPDRWNRPGLGTWTIRQLVGHASRALSTIEASIGEPGTGALVDGPVAYYLIVGQDPPGSEGRRARDESIAERGREAAAALGDDVAGAVAELADRVVALVSTLPDDTALHVAAGSMTLSGYLPTRTFELTVHTLDLAGAVGVTPPDTLAVAVAASLELAGRLAGVHPDAGEVLLALCGRNGLPGGFSVV